MALLDFFNIASQNRIMDLFAAVIILIAGFLVAGLLSKLVRKVLRDLETNKILKEHAQIKFPIEEFISQIIKYAIYLTSIIWALNQIGLTSTVLQIIIAILIILFIIFVVLAIKDFIPNVVSGMVIHQKGTIKKGETIRIKNIEGKVIHTDLNEIRLMTKNKEIVHIPNSYLTKHEVTKLN